MITNDAGPLSGLVVEGHGVHVERATNPRHSRSVAAKRVHSGRAEVTCDEQCASL